MNCLQNLHTHSTFCDGADTPEEMVLEAIEKGFDSIGFSGHSYMHFSESFSQKMKNPENYKTEITRLKTVYSEKIKIFLGIEQEILSETDMNGYDYLIGSVHYFKIDGVYVGFDRSREAVADVINNHFGGDGMKYAKAYYSQLSRLPEYGKFDIIGHFDLITKHSDKVKFFDEDSHEYKSAAIEAAEALAGKIPLFEVNTGAIARGNRKTPYPAPFMLKELKRLGFGAIISSDCHNKKMLDCYFDEAAELLKSCGFKEKFILTEDGFRAVPL